jgi:prefoldin subunit 4
LEEEIAKLREEINRITDASDEIILTDDIKYLIGEVFIDVDSDNAETLLEKEKKRIEKLIKVKEVELKKIQETSKQLKGMCVSTTTHYDRCSIFEVWQKH